MCNTQRLSLVHTEGPCSLAVTVAFWPILLPVACFAVDFIHMNSNGCTVQVLTTHHAQEAGPVEAPPITEHLFSKVNCLLAAATFVSSTQRHPAVKRCCQSAMMDSLKIGAVLMQYVQETSGPQLDERVVLLVW